MFRHQHRCQGNNNSWGKFHCGQGPHAMAFRFSRFLSHERGFYPIHPVQRILLFMSGIFVCVETVHLLSHVKHFIGSKIRKFVKSSGKKASQLAKEKQRRVQSEVVNSLMPQRLWYLLHKTITQAPRKPAGAITPISSIKLYKNSSNSSNSSSKKNKEVKGKSHESMKDNDTGKRRDTVEADTSMLSFHQTLTFRLVLPTNDKFSLTNIKNHNTIKNTQLTHYNKTPKNEGGQEHWTALYLLWTDQVRYSVNTGELQQYLLKWANELSHVNLHSIAQSIHSQHETLENMSEWPIPIHKEWTEVDLLSEFAELSLMWYLELTRQVYESLVIHEDINSCNDVLDQINEHAPIIYNAFIRPYKLHNTKYMKTDNHYMICYPHECWAALEKILHELHYARRRLLWQGIKHLLHYIYVAAKVKYSSYYLFIILSFMSSRINAFEPMMRARLTSLIQQLFSNFPSSNATDLCSTTTTTSGCKNSQLHSMENNTFNNNSLLPESSCSSSSSSACGGGRRVVITPTILQQLILVSICEIARMSLHRLFSSVASYLITVTAAWRRQQYKAKIYNALTHLPLSFYDLHGFDEVEQIVYYVNDLEGVDVSVHLYLFNALHSLIAMRNSLSRLSPNGKMVVFVSVLCSSLIKYNVKVFEWIRKFILGNNDKEQSWLSLVPFIRWIHWNHTPSFHLHHHHSYPRSLEEWYVKFIRGEMRKSKNNYKDNKFIYSVEGSMYHKVASEVDVHATHYPTLFLLESENKEKSNSYNDDEMEKIESSYYYYYDDDNHEKDEDKDDKSDQEADNDTFNRNGAMLREMEIIASLPSLRPYGAEVSLMKWWNRFNNFEETEQGNNNNNIYNSANDFNGSHVTAATTRQIVWRYIWMNQLDGQFVRSLISSLFRLLEWSCSVTAIAYGTHLTFNEKVEEPSSGGCPFSRLCKTREGRQNDEHENETHCCPLSCSSTSLHNDENKTNTCLSEITTSQEIENKTSLPESPTSEMLMFEASQISSRFSEAIFNMQSGISTVIDARHVIEVMLLNAYKATILERLCNHAYWEVDSIPVEQIEKKHYASTLQGKQKWHIEGKELDALPLSILFRSPQAQVYHNNNNSSIINSEAQTKFLPPELAVCSIRLHNVQFAYPTAPTIPVFHSPLSFSINLYDFKTHRGKLIVIAGRSGCGKSTLLSLLLGLYDLPSIYEFSSIKNSRKETKLIGNKTITKNEAENKTIEHDKQNVQKNEKEELPGEDTPSIELLLMSKNAMYLHVDPNADNPTTSSDKLESSNISVVSTENSSNTSSDDDKKKTIMYESDIKHMPRQWIRGPLFGYIPQSPFIIPGATIAHNVSLEPHITLTSSHILDKVAQCIKWAQCDAFVRKYPEGLLTRIAPFVNSGMLNTSEDVSGMSNNVDGWNSNSNTINTTNNDSGSGGSTLFKRAGVIGLSGGQAQRLMLARALYQSHGVLLMDEPTANLDRDTKQHVINTWRQLMTDKQIDAIICCSHDDVVLEAVDEVIYLDKK